MGFEINRRPWKERKSICVKERWKRGEKLNKKRNLLLLSWLLLSRVRLFRKILGCRHSWGLPSTNLLILFSFHFIKEMKERKMKKKTTFLIWFKRRERAISSWATERMGQKTKKVYIYKVEATKVSKTTRTTTITERKTIESFNRFGWKGPRHNGR